jgi:hypothetical protein
MVHSLEPTGTQRLFLKDSAISERPAVGCVEIEATWLLVDFVREFGKADEAEYAKLLGGVYDLHPDIRWCPSDVVPGD